ncbi:tetratricopeptide repeat protein [Prosthecobacter sp.]|uniref:tetratricopeptide repeat protein n=1 Tax=Prosthecobacter sp. TaxID=1965333 RepID=UPI002AB7F6B4|nr:tetratricopeptide repeat protein [Prosthecobacter sp.]MDZ4401910.1 tetratricopeptide repeat protein [Prosthecobacter sp.]
MAAFLGAVLSLRAAAPADLTLGVKAPEKSDLQLSRGGEVYADVLAHYSAALQFESSGKLRQALEHYLAVFKADPTNADLAAHTAGIAMQFQGREAAVNILEDAVRANPRSPAPLLHLTRFASTYPPEDLFEKDERPAKAMAEALEKFPMHAEVYEVAVMLHLTQNERDKAIAVMDQAANQNSRDPQFWLATGRTAERVWPLGQAEFRLEYSQRVAPFFENALKQVTKADAEQVTLEVAQQYLLTNDPERARQLCEKLAAEHNSLDARKLLYRLYGAAEQKDKALATLEQIVKQAPDDAEQRRLLANEYDKLKQPEKAILHLEAAIQNGGGEIGDYVKLGWELYQTQKYEDMVRVGQRSVRLFPDHPLVHYQLAIAHRAREEWASSVKHFAEAEQFAGSTQTELLDHLFYYQYGVTLERMARYEDASRMLEKSITLTPREESKAAANTLNFLGYMWLEQGSHLDKAGEFITKANELLPDQPAYIDSLGWFHYKKGDYTTALKDLQRAESLLEQIQPEDAEILEHLGLAHQSLGDKAKALEYLERANALNTPDLKARKRIEEALKKLKGGGKTDTEKK